MPIFWLYSRLYSDLLQALKGVLGIISSGEPVWPSDKALGW